MTLGVFGAAAGDPSTSIQVRPDRKWRSTLCSINPVRVALFIYNGRETRRRIGECVEIEGMGISSNFVLQ
jgi:hypothetical protein